MNSKSNLLLLTIMSLLCFSSAQRPKQPFSLSLSTEHANVKLGSAIPIQVVLTNTSGRDLQLARSLDTKTAEFNFDIEVRGDHGIRVRETRHLRSVKGEDSVPQTHSNQIVTIGPTDSLKEEAALESLYDLSRPGKYVVWAERRIPKEIGSGVIKSNQITILVSP